MRGRSHPREGSREAETENGQPPKGETMSIHPASEESTRKPSLLPAGTAHTGTGNGAGGPPKGPGDGGNGASTGDDRPHAEARKIPVRGESDPRGSKIDDVFWVTERFHIYEAEGQVRYALTGDYENCKKLRRRIADLGGLRASIEDLRAEKTISDIERKRAAREIAWALADAFEDEAEAPSGKPKEVLTRVDARLRSLVKSACRRKFALANLMAFAVIEAILIAGAVLLPDWVRGGPLEPLPRYALFGAMGGLGAFLSVMMGIRSIDVNLDLKSWEHIFAGATRIFIGVVGAWIVALALASQIVDPTFGSNPATAAGDPGTYGLEPRIAMALILTFIAGFSESLVPSLLRRGEQAAGGDKADDPIVAKPAAGAPQETKPGGSPAAPGTAPQDA